MPRERGQRHRQFVIPDRGECGSFKQVRNSVAKGPIDLMSVHGTGELHRGRPADPCPDRCRDRPRHLHGAMPSISPRGRSSCRWPSRTIGAVPRRIRGLPDVAPKAQEAATSCPVRIASAHLVVSEGCHALSELLASAWRAHGRTTIGNLVARSAQSASGERMDRQRSNSAAPARIAPAPFRSPTASKQVRARSTMEGL